MTIDEYWAAVKRLGLRPSNVRGVFFTRTNDTQGVPDPTNMTPEQRVETIERLKALMGIAPPSGRYH